MSLGASFALAPDELDQLLACQGDGARMAWLEDLEESVAGDAWFQFDKAWDALHRCLGDGRLEIPVDGPPLAYAVFGSVPLMEDPDSPMFAGLLPAVQVAAVVDALSEVDEEAFRQRYLRLEESDYDQPLAEEDFAYTWACLGDFRPFLARAADQGRAVIFTVDG